MDAFNFLLNLLFDLRIPPLVTIVWTNFLQFEDPAACELDITALHWIPHLSDILCSIHAVLHVNNLLLLMILPFRSEFQTPIIEKYVFPRCFKEKFKEYTKLSFSFRIKGHCC